MTSGPSMSAGGEESSSVQGPPMVERSKSQVAEVPHVRYSEIEDIEERVAGWKNHRQTSPEWVTGLLGIGGTTALTIPVLVSGDDPVTTVAVYSTVAVLTAAGALREWSRARGERLWLHNEIEAICKRLKKIMGKLPPDDDPDPQSPAAE